MTTKYLKEVLIIIYLWRSLNVCFKKFKNFELIKLLGEGQSYKFIKLKMKMMFFESLKNIQDDFESFRDNFKNFKN